MAHTAREISPAYQDELRSLIPAATNRTRELQPGKVFPAGWFHLAAFREVLQESLGTQECPTLQGCRELLEALPWMKNYGGDLFHARVWQGREEQ